MTSNIKLINDFFLKFLEEHASDAVDNWKSSDVQKEFTKLFTEKGKGKKGKKEKDLNAPKRAKSAYIFFCTDKRAEVKAENPEISAKDIMSEISLLWKKYQEEEPDSLAEYKAQAAADKERYEAEKKVYSGGGEKEKKSRKKSESGEKKVKGKRSALAFFTIDEKQVINSENNSLKGKEVMEEVRLRWNRVKSEASMVETLNKYKAMSDEDKLRYDREVAEFGMPPKKQKAAEKASESNDDEETTQPNPPTSEGSDKETDLPQTDSVPEKKGTSYTRFCKQRRPILKEKNPNTKAVDITKMISTEWAALSKAEKDKY